MFLILIFQQFERQSSYAYQPEISNVMASITIGWLNKIDMCISMSFTTTSRKRDYKVEHEVWYFLD